ncbi:MAG: beta-ketoacyl-[acyl-carrier-protein] synthase family protein [Planctomycetales bacterium]|nr:beta-ketoacyl-[acyl-carrier-protein] synthase family protein [Planctomycetales bacterium]
MPRSVEVVITGVGVVAPNGIGREAFWRSLCEQRSGVRHLELAGVGDFPAVIGGEIVDFDPKAHIQPRKSLKVMCREIVYGVAAASLAVDDAGISDGSVDPERFGAVYGADMMHMAIDELESPYRVCIEDGKFDFARWGTRAHEEFFPLFMLKYLPNMPACHIAIRHDARGPNNSIVLGEVSSLSALAEAARVIERGDADVMVAGGTGSRLHPTTLVRSCVSQLSQRHDDPTTASRPFDADRDGMVNGEGAAALVIESRAHAERRGAPVFGVMRGYASTFATGKPTTEAMGGAIERAIALAIADAGMSGGDIGCVNANGLGTTVDDAIEARAIRATLGDVPVTAPKSYFGNLAAGSGAVEAAASIIGLPNRLAPATLNYERPDPACAINVIHGEPARLERPGVLLLNQAPTGQSVAVLVCAE